MSAAQQSFDNTTEAIIAAADALLRLPKRPDGWLVFGAETYLAVATHLSRLGIRVGRMSVLFAAMPIRSSRP